MGGSSTTCALNVCKLLSTEVASRSPSSLIHHKSVFRCVSIDGARLGHLVLLDRGVEADCALRRFAVSPCASLIDPLPLPSCSSSNSALLLNAHRLLDSESERMLQNRGSCAVLGCIQSKRFRTWQRAGECCIFGTSFSGCSHLAKSWKLLHLWYSISGYLLVFGYFCCFLACDLALLQVLRCSQPYSLEFVRSPRFEHFEHFGHLAQHLFQCHALSIVFFVLVVHGRFKPLKDFGFLVTCFGPLRKFNAPIPNNDGQSHLAYL